MALCDTECSLRRDGSHPRLIRLVSSDIDTLAGEMGFSARTIANREFRAHKQGGHIVGIIDG
jgi:hypothetical protein